MDQPQLTWPQYSGPLDQSEMSIAVLWPGSPHLDQDLCLAEYREVKLVAHLYPAPATRTGVTSPGQWSVGSQPVIRIGDMVYNKDKEVSASLIGQ